METLSILLIFLAIGTADSECLLIPLALLASGILFYKLSHR